MKHLSIYTITLIAGLYLGDALKGTTRYHDDIGQVKAAPVTKYYFIGYRIDNQGQSSTGNVEWIVNDGMMPNKHELFKFLQKKLTGITFDFNQLVIVGMYEFKSKHDCDQFYQFQKEKK
jgi:hypothetical protein